MAKIDTTEIENIIHGKIEPHIYAFQTGTIPNYLKVGDTYRPVAMRLDEWRRPNFFPDLIPVDKTWSARLDETAYFRDFEVHQYLMREKHRERLTPALFPNAYFSKEFFKDATPLDVDEAVEDIESAYKTHSAKYSVYSLEEKHSQEYHYERNAAYPLRPNQEATVKRFVEAKSKGYKKMLMYAVMRFGKSFTSMECALKADAKFVLVVSGKADVKEEWKKTVESHVDFKDYLFLTKSDLEKNQNIITETLSQQNSPNRVVVFVTLQDLQGDKIKKKHRDIFSSKIDLLIVDETHFAARSEKLGAVIEKKSAETNLSSEEKYTVDDVAKFFEKKHLQAEITLHLSGTPYRILMNGEFERDAIIAFYQFSDIVADRQNWYEENRDKILVGDDSVRPVYEWDNPYFGFPEMIRFAFHPNQSSLERMRHLKDSGESSDFADLFQTYSNDANEENHDKFKYEQEVLDFLKIIDGKKEDENIFAFLDYDKIKEGRMCRHIVMVLPFCASCDAMAKLLEERKEEFINLREYKVLNISGWDSPAGYSDPKIIKQTISDYEANDQKTLTLTVNRLLTGSTVPEWDTMIYLKDTQSPQDYDQAIFRLQSPFVKTYTEGDKVLKIDMKPQTLLVDFKPDRMFVLQGKKSGIQNANLNQAGGNELGKRIERDLAISPIIELNHNKLCRVQAPKIIEAISNYSIERGVFDEVADIPVDVFLRNNQEIYNFICALPEFKSKQGIIIPASNPENGDELETEQTANGKEKPTPSTTEQPPESGNTSANQAGTGKDNFEAKFRTYYANLLYYAFLTSDKVNSIDQILSTIDSFENARIARNLGISKEFLTLLRTHINPTILGEWDNRIFNINRLANDESVPPLERALTVIGQLSKISASEVKTPEKICNQMVARLPSEFLRSAVANGHKFLDIASKTGEFAIALYERMKEAGIAEELITNSIYSIPTSKMAYEFVLKFYNILGLNPDNISAFTSYDLLKVKDENGEIEYDKIVKLLQQNKPFNDVLMSDKPEEGADMITFDAIVGNPPYQEDDGGAQKSAKPIYNYIVEISKKMNPTYITLITPTRWFAGGKGLDVFRNIMLNDVHIRELHDFLHPEEVFPDINNRGGICYFLMDKTYDNTTDLVDVITHDKGDTVRQARRPMKTRDLEIFIRDSQAISILDKVIPAGTQTETLEKYISAAKAFGFRTFFIQDSLFRPNPDGLNQPVKCYGRSNKSGYVEKSEIKSHKEWIKKWKVYVPESNNIGTELNDDNQNSFVGAPDTICTETYLVVGAELGLTEQTASNLSNYLRTKFARYMLSLAKISQHGTAKTYRFVPLQDFTENSDIDWSKSIADIDKQLYAKYGLTAEEIAFMESTIKPME